MSNLLGRIITGVLGAALLVGGAWLGGWYFAGLVVLIAVIGQWEWYRLLRQAGFLTWRFAGFSMGLLLVLHPLVPGGASMAMLPLAALLMWIPFSKSDMPLHRFCATVSGAFYPAALLSFFLHLRHMEEGLLMTLTVFLLVWVSDICAYVVGSLWGRHKLAPTISPNKTWEGYVAGLVGPIAAGLVLFHVVTHSLGLAQVLVLAVICGVASASGDLAASRFKRAARLGDTGRLLPGHGGVLDRFDGMTVAAPLAYLFLLVV